MRVANVHVTGVGMPAVPGISMASNSADRHSDQSYAAKGESGQVNIHALIYLRRPSPWQAMSMTTAAARTRT